MGTPSAALKIVLCEGCCVAEDRGDVGLAAVRKIRVRDVIFEPGAVSRQTYLDEGADFGRVPVFFNISVSEVLWLYGLTGVSSAHVRPRARWCADVFARPLACRAAAGC
jgi:hypothetical protein